MCGSHDIRWAPHHTSRASAAAKLSQASAVQRLFVSKHGHADGVDVEVAWGGAGGVVGGYLEGERGVAERVGRVPGEGDGGDAVGWAGWGVVAEAGESRVA